MGSEQSMGEVEGRGLPTRAGPEFVGVKYLSVIDSCKKNKHPRNLKKKMRLAVTRLPRRRSLGFVKRSFTTLKKSAWGRIPVQKNKQPNNENMQKWWTKKETLRLPLHYCDGLSECYYLNPIKIQRLICCSCMFSIEVVGTSCWSITLILLL